MSSSKNIIVREKKVKTTNGLYSIKFIMKPPRKGYRFVIDDWGILKTKKIKRRVK